MSKQQEVESREMRGAKDQYEHDKNKLKSEVGKKVEDVKDYAEQKKEDAKEYGKEWKDYAKQKAEDVKDYTHDKKEEAKECGKEWKDYAKEKTEDVKDYTHDKKEEFKHQARDAKDYVKDTTQEAKDYTKEKAQNVSDKMEDIREDRLNSNYLEQSRRDASSNIYNENLDRSSKIKDATLYGKDQGIDSEPLGYHGEFEKKPESPQEGGILQSAKETIASAYNVVATKVQETTEAAKEKMESFLHPKEETHIHDRSAELSREENVTRPPTDVSIIKEDIDKSQVNY